MSHLLVLAILALGLMQIALGFMRLQHMLGLWAALAGICSAFLFRFMPPVAIGSYFGAVEVMGWPWWVGALAVAPGLLFILPSIMGALMAGRRV